VSLPDFILTCLGTFDSFDGIKKVVADIGSPFELDEEFSQLEEDDRMTVAFEASYDLITETMRDRDWERVAKHTAVAYFIVREVPDEFKVPTMKAALELIGALIDAKLITAIKCDSSGIAHGLQEWKRIADVAKAGAGDVETLLFHAWVRKPLADEDCHYSCGMHLFGEADFTTREQDEDKLVALFDNAFAAARLGVDNGVSFKKPAIEVSFYPEDHPYYNKYGYREIL
jgi:hypothetical protein